MPSGASGDTVAIGRLTGEATTIQYSGRGLPQAGNVSRRRNPLFLKCVSLRGRRIRAGKFPECSNPAGVSPHFAKRTQHDGAVTVPLTSARPPRPPLCGQCFRAFCYLSKQGWFLRMTVPSPWLAPVHPSNFSFGVTFPKRLPLTSPAPLNCFLGHEALGRQNCMQFICLPDKSRGL